MPHRTDPRHFQNPARFPVAFCRIPGVAPLVQSSGMHFWRFARMAVFLLTFATAADEGADARAVFQRTCAICHGTEGEGWPAKNGPTLRQTEWVTGDADRLIRITLDGLALRIPLLNGTHYGAMPGVRDQLTDEEISGVITLIRGSWGNKATPVNSQRVAAVRAASPPRVRPWTAAELGLSAAPKLGPNDEALEPPDPFAAAGFKTYQAICQNCHQPTGRGIVTLDGHGFPPLRDSEFVNGSPSRLIRIVLGGLQGDVTVNDKAFKELMPAWQAALSDEQAAQVLTFVRQAWSNLARPIRTEEVRQLRAESVARGGIPWTLADLDRAERGLAPEQR
jgi:mono/diheme cytochrome c family protein